MAAGFCLDLDPDLGLDLIPAGSYGTYLLIMLLFKGSIAISL